MTRRRREIDLDHINFKNGCIGEIKSNKKTLNMGTFRDTIEAFETRIHNVDEILWAPHISSLIFRSL